jgi:hypothetical protein
LPEFGENPLPLTCLMTMAMTTLMVAVDKDITVAFAIFTKTT